MTSLEPSVFDLNSVVIDAALPLPELLRSVERQIVRTPFETAFAFTETGVLLLRKAGKHDAVAFTETESLAIQESYFTHNHPQRSFLSAADIIFAHRHKLAEMRAVAGEVVHLLVRPATGWNETEANRLFVNANNRLARQFSHDGNRRKLLAGQQRLVQTLIRRLSLSVETQSL